jgi:hypothetical protein
VPALYATLGILLATNLLGLLGGAWIKLLPIAIQMSIIASVYTCKAWAYVAVRVWSAICIFSGTAFWLAVLLRGGEFSQTPAFMTFETLLLLMSVMFFKGAKVVLSKRVHLDPVSPEAHQE